MSDSIYCPELAASRRRIEVPTLNDELLQVFRRNGPANTIPIDQRDAVISEARAVVLDELNLCEETSGAPTLSFIGAIWSVLKYRIPGPDVSEGLKCLYWRGRMQNAILDTFMYLCKVDLLDMECLRKPFSVMAESKQVGRLTGILCCFEGSYRNERIDPGFFHYDVWHTAEAWLATMILRSTADIGKSLDYIAATRFLGQLNETQWDEWNQWDYDLHFAHNPRENVGIQGQANDFGFWLPHGLGATPDAFAAGFKAHENRFIRIEKAFKAYFDVPDEQIALKADEEDFLRRHPNKDPSRSIPTLPLPASISPSAGPSSAIR